MNTPPRGEEALREPGIKVAIEKLRERSGRELSDANAEAFRVLCAPSRNAKGCEPDTLATLVLFWAQLDPVALEKSVQEIHLNAMDDWGAALGALQPRDVERLRRALRTEAARLKKLALRVNNLQVTRLFRYMAIDSQFTADAGFLDLAGRMKRFSDSIIPKMVEACKLIGPKRQPMKTRRLVGIANYVKNCKGRFHYQELADFLSHFEPMKVATLKKIISSHRLTGRR
jgi:hypothetical protein